jgi:low affinity Fe/Cu permease
MTMDYLMLASEQCVNDADPSDEQLDKLLKQIRESQAEMLGIVRSITQTLLDCRDRMEDRPEFRDLVTRIEALGLYRLN